MVRALALPAAPAVGVSRLRVDRARRKGAADPRERRKKTARNEAVRLLHENVCAGSQTTSKASLPARRSGQARPPTGAEEARQDKSRQEKRGNKGGQIDGTDEEGEDQGGSGQQDAQRRGRPPMSQRERLRWKIAKWRRITHAVQKWSGTLKTDYVRKWGGKGFWTQECLSNL